MSADDTINCDADVVTGDNLVTQVVQAVPEGWRAKIAKVVLQLMVGTEHGANMYSNVRERIDYIEGRSLINQRIAETVAEQVVKDPEVVERAKARYLYDILKKQENLEAVISGAVEYLPALPPPDRSPEPTADEQSGGAESDPIEDEPTPLNPDWAASFTAFAENASSVDLRQRLARILAGEMQTPGSYPRSTVRALVELERSDLEAMQVVLPLILKDAIFPQLQPERFPTIDQLLPLVDSGLILDANAGLHRYWQAAADSSADVDQSIIGAEWGQQIRMKPGTRFQFDIVPLTRTGMALVELLGRPDERIILRRLAEEIPKSGVTSIKLGRIEGGFIRFSEQLFPAPAHIFDLSLKI